MNTRFLFTLFTVYAFLSKMAEAGNQEGPFTYGKGGLGFSACFSENGTKKTVNYMISSENEALLKKTTDAISKCKHISPASLPICEGAFADTKFYGKGLFAGNRTKAEISVFDAVWNSKSEKWVYPEDKCVEGAIERVTPTGFGTKEDNSLSLGFLVGALSTIALLLLGYAVTHPSNVKNCFRFFGDAASKCTNPFAGCGERKNYVALT